MDIVRAQRTALCPKGGEDVTVPVLALSLLCISLAFSSPLFPFHRVSWTPTFRRLSLQPFPLSPLPPLRRESLVLPFVCALVEGQLSLSHTHALSLARVCMLLSHTLSRSTVRVCSRRSIHIAHSFRFASRERLSSSLSQWFREQVFEHPAQSHPLLRPSCPLTALNRRRSPLPEPLHPRAAAHPPRPSMSLRC
jgi:hypothetical protein